MLSMRRRRGAQGYCICTEPLTVALTPDLPASTGNGGAAAAMSADAALKRGSGGREGLAGVDLHRAQRHAC